jgi:recombinational DNA repair ATPase RecF
LRRHYLLCMADGRAVTPPSDLPSRPDLSPALSALTEESRRLRAAAHTDQRRAMVKQLSELDDRFKIAPLKTILHQEVLRLESIDALEPARNDCDTTRITRKRGEAAQTVVTASMRSAFASNLTQLGFYSTPVEVKLGAGTIGQHPYYLSLIARADVRPSEVLSEGEKTCVALAGFLAELETTNTLSGIVLDDPVSSLDHNYRERVARRLVEAARQRQVIVFTHDIVFFLLLNTLPRKRASRPGRRV